MNRTSRVLAVLLMSVAAFAAPLEAEPETPEVKLVNANAPAVSTGRWKQALLGFDPVAYFDYGEPTPGADEYHVTVGSALYSFASRITMKKFQSSPEEYLPRFGGYCALSLALEPGELAEREPGLYQADPKLFKIVDGRLYLFASDIGIDAIARWNENEAAYLARAEQRWKALREKKK